MGLRAPLGRGYAQEPLSLIKNIFFIGINELSVNVLCVDNILIFFDMCLEGAKCTSAVDPKRTLLLEQECTKYLCINIFVGK